MIYVLIAVILIAFSWLINHFTGSTEYSNLNHDFWYTVVHFITGIVGGFFSAIWDSFWSFFHL